MVLVQRHQRLLGHSHQELEPSPLLLRHHGRNGSSEAAKARHRSRSSDAELKKLAADLRAVEAAGAVQGAGHDDDG